MTYELEEDICYNYHILKKYSIVEGQAVIFKFKEQIYCCIRTSKKNKDFGFLTLIYSSDIDGNYELGKELYHRRDILIRHAIKEFTGTFLESSSISNSKRFLE